MDLPSICASIIRCAGRKDEDGAWDNPAPAFEASLYKVELSRF
jgi:hypothetical protein